MGFGDYYSHTVKVNGETVYSSRYSLGCYGMMPMNSCFGFGYCGYPGYGMGFGYPFMCGGGIRTGIGIGLGVAAGTAAVALLPSICSGVATGAKAIGKGVSNLWNKIFHKN